MKILITGGKKGFISGNLIDYFLKNEDKVSSFSRSGTDVLCVANKNVLEDLKCDITHVDSIKQLMNTVKPDVILHCAAIPTIKPDKEKPFEITDINIGGTHKLLEYAPFNCIFVLASSVVVYGNTRGRISDIEKVELKPTSIYGVTKLAAEALVQSYHEQGKVRGRILRLCATVGKGLTHGIVKDFINKIQSNEPELNVLGKWPGSVKPFCHINDVIEAFKVAIDYPKKDCLVANVVPEDEISCERVAESVMYGLRKFKPIHFLGEGSTWQGDNSKIEVYADKLKYFGWQPAYTRSEAAIEAAVKEIVNTNE